MKLIDKNGRLFGKISVIDVLVILVVIVLAVALNYKGNQPQTSTAIEDEEITFQISARALRTYQADALQIGDTLYERDNTAVGALGEVVDIQIVDGLRYAEFRDGTVDYVPSADTVDLLVTVKGSGIHDGSRSLINRIYEVAVNSSRVYKTKYVQFPGTIANVY